LDFVHKIEGIYFQKQKKQELEGMAQVDFLLMFMGEGVKNVLAMEL